MNGTIEVQTSPGRLSSKNPPDTGPAARSTNEPQQQPPTESVSPVRTQPNEVQSPILPLRKERQLATNRQSAHLTATMDSGEFHLFLCHRPPTAKGPSQISSTYMGRYRNVEEAINHASQASIPADIVLVIHTALLEEQPDIDPGEPDQTKNKQADVQTANKN